MSTVIPYSSKFSKLVFKTGTLTVSYICPNESTAFLTCILYKLRINCQALCPFCVCVCKSYKNGHRLTLKSLFIHHPPPTRKLFLVSNERYGKNKTFLLQWYGIDFAPIKRYRPFCFLWLYIRRQRLSLYDLSTLCP